MSAPGTRGPQRLVSAIVPAAGMGTRFGKGTNKPFTLLGGEPLLIRTLKTLESVSRITEVIPVLKKEDVDSGKKMFAQYGLKKVRHIAVGGRERQDSVWNGLQLVQDSGGIVVIHDGVRPLVEKNLVHKAIEEMEKADATHRRRPSPGHVQVNGVVLGVLPKDTIKEAEGGIVTKTFARDSLRAVQTPQVFPYAVIASAYEKAVKEGYYSTDDAALVEKYGGRIKVIHGSYVNIKITTPEDLMIAESLLSWRTSS